MTSWVSLLLPYLALLLTDVSKVSTVHCSQVTYGRIFLFDNTNYGLIKIGRYFFLPHIPQANFDRNYDVKSHVSRQARLHLVQLSIIRRQPAAADGPEAWLPHVRKQLEPKIQTL